MTYLFCATLYYGVILPVRFVTRTVRNVVLCACVATGAYILGCFVYGVYMGLNGL